MKEVLSYLRVGTRSLKTTLALYFIPISIIPTFSISYYAYKLFEENTKESLIARARSERDGIVQEIEAAESDLLSLSRNHSKSNSLRQAMARRNKSDVADVIDSFRLGYAIRVYGPNGEFLAARKVEEDPNRIDYLSKEGLARTRQKGETIDRFFSPDGGGLVTVVRQLLKDNTRVYGVLEEELHFGKREMSELKSRRDTDIVFFGRDLTLKGASFAVRSEDLENFSRRAVQLKASASSVPVFVNLGDTRFGGFLYDLPSELGKNKRWGYVGVFLSMTSVDSTLNKLKLAIIYLTVLLMLTAAFAIFVFSNRLVKPIVTLVSAMKRVKTGRVEQIPSVDSTYEIEYLVHSFNDMTRNVSAAKRALEIKLEELRNTNVELKNTQSTLVQSAKMISLGQIVAGVAHELNNPIGFIYSNMHHLQEYVAKIKQAITGYRKAVPQLPKPEQDTIAKMEQDLEIDFILKDTEDLTRSCVEGANRTRDIVLGLRTFSRVEDASYRLADIHEGLRSTIRLLASEFKDRIKVQEDYGPLPQIECNLSQMNQVFMNLLSNAAHAIQGPGEIWIRTSLEGRDVVIEIEDSGSGMPPEVVEKIFDPFFTTKQVGQGTGLGLSIAYGLVQKHHGTITVRTEVGKGTCFTIRMPTTQPAILTA